MVCESEIVPFLQVLGSLGTGTSVIDKVQMAKPFLILDGTCLSIWASCTAFVPVIQSNITPDRKRVRSGEPLDIQMQAHVTDHTCRHACTWHFTVLQDIATTCKAIVICNPRMKAAVPERPRARKLRPWVQIARSMTRSSTASGIECRVRVCKYTLVQGLHRRLLLAIDSASIYAVALLVLSFCSRLSSPPRGKSSRHVFELAMR